MTSYTHAHAMGARELAILRVFSFPSLLGSILVLGAFLVARAFRVDSDTWWHLVVGERIIRTHSWPTSDIYSSTAAGTGWIAYEWLGEVVVAVAARLGGLAGLMGLLAVLAAGVMLLLYYYAYLRCGNAKAAFVACLLVLPLAGVWFSLHPQLLGFIGLLVTLICLEHFRQGSSKPLWLLPIVFVLWVNSHPTFALGALVLGIYWLSGVAGFSVGGLFVQRWSPAERLQLAMVAFLSLLASCVTPYGTRLAARPLELAFLGGRVTGEMASWQPIPLNQWHGQLFLALVLLYVVALAAFRPKLRLEEFVLFLFAVFMTFQHSRGLPVFAFIFAPILASLLARWVPAYAPAKDLYALNATLLAFVALGLVKALPSQIDLAHGVATRYPGVEYLREHPPPGPMLNDIESGGYLLYSLGPEHRVFIDGRLDDPVVFSDYLHIMRLEADAPSLLRKYNVRSCFLAAATPLRTFLAASPDWERVYEDQLSVLFVRREPEKQESPLRLFEN